MSLSTILRPSVEVAIVKIAGRNVEDENTPEGKLWRFIFSQITSIKGFKRVGWGRRSDDPDTNLFIVDWATLQDHFNFMDAYGTLSKEIMNLLTDDFDMYHIFPETPFRSFYYAPVTSVQFFWHPRDEQKFVADIKLLVTTMEREVGCRGLVWGEAMEPPKHEMSGMLLQGKGYLVLTGWDNLEALNTSMSGSTIAKLNQRVGDGVKTAPSYNVSLHVVEPNGYEVVYKKL